VVAKVAAVEFTWAAPEPDLNAQPTPGPAGVKRVFDTKIAGQLWARRPGGNGSRSRTERKSSLRPIGFLLHAKGILPKEVKSVRKREISGAAGW
jgi:hypothetical protein